MSLINKKYDKVVCISLKERDDKYTYMKSQFKKHNIDVEFFRPVIPGYAQSLVLPYAKKHNVLEKNLIYFNTKFPNELGAMQSHYHVIKTAYLEGVENLFVFEDDCAFHKDWKTLLPKYLDTIPDDADGILLYSFMNKLEQQNVRVKPRWTQGYASWSFLGYGLNKRAMKGYIYLQDQQPMIADKGSWAMMTHYDYKFYIASPPLVIPSKTLTSSIRGEDKNYDKIQNVFMLGVDPKNYE